MTQDKNTDKIFREKLEGFSVPPPSHLWDNILGELAAQKRKKHMLYMGWISAAAVVLLAFVAGWYFNENTNQKINPASDSELVLQEKNKTEKTNDAAQFNNIEVIQPEPEKTKLAGITLKKEAQKVNPISAHMESTDNSQNGEKTVVRENLNLEFLSGIEISFETAENALQPELRKKKIQSKYNVIPDQILIAENIQKINSEKSSENNWKMGMYVSPGYSSHVANHTDSYNKLMTYSENTGNVNVNGGFSLQYKTGKRWSVESGVYYAQNGQKSENSIHLLSLNQNADFAFAPVESDKIYFGNAVQVENGNLQMNSTAGVIEFSGTPKGTEITSDFDSRAEVSNALISSGEFSQVFDFVEIPLYVRYKLLDSKFGVDLLGGVNAGVVVGNNAFIDNEFGLQKIGETKDISTVNLSGTVGLGLNYAVGKHFSLAVEPRLNYYLNSINQNPDVDFRPYRIGLFTGVYYEF